MNDYRYRHLLIDIFEDIGQFKYMLNDKTFLRENDEMDTLDKCLIFIDMIQKRIDKEVL